MERTVESLEDLQKEAAGFVARLAPGAGATLVTLSGELGAGKTAFSKAAAHALGVEDVVNSPTFVLEKIYPLAGGPFARFVHIDAYRLENGSELAPLGFEALMQDAGNLVFLEWPEKVAHALPVPAARISFEVLPGGARRLAYDHGA